ncbi:MAG: type II secretion system protein GspG [Pirellulales bacterium]
MSAPVFCTAAVRFLSCCSLAASLAFYLAAAVLAQDSPRPATASSTRQGTVDVVGIADTSNKMLDFSRDGRILVGGSGDHTVKTWDAATGKPGPTLERHNSAVLAVHFTADGKSLLSAGKEIKRWDAQTWALVETVELEKWQQPYEARFSPDGKRLAMIDAEGQLMVYDAASGLQLCNVKLKGMPLTLEFTPDGKSIAIGVVWMDAATKGSSIQFVHASTGQLERTIETPGTSVSAIAFSAGGDLLAYSGFQKVVVTSAKDGKPVKELPGHVGMISAIAFSPDGTILASGGEGPGFRLPYQWMQMSETRMWDMKTGRQTWANVGELARVKSIAFSPDGTQLARCDAKTVLKESIPDNGRDWVQYVSKSGGIGRDMSDASRFRQQEAARGNAAAAAAPGAVQRNAAKVQVDMLTSAINLYRVTVDRHPSDLGDLVNQPADAAIAKRWAGPYLREKPKPDPWGNDYRYSSPGTRNPKSFDIWSAGPDGQDGTADDIGNSSEPPRGNTDRK